jgi:hypothetical protein
VRFLIGSRLDVPNFTPGARFVRISLRGQVEKGTFVKIALVGGPCRERSSGKDRVALSGGLR